MEAKKSEVNKRQESSSSSGNSQVTVTGQQMQMWRGSKADTQRIKSERSQFTSELEKQIAKVDKISGDKLRQEAIDLAYRLKRVTDLHHISSVQTAIKNTQRLAGQ
jgi:predicted transcriptional regulator